MGGDVDDRRMKAGKTTLSGVYLIQTDVFADDRGDFAKIFNHDAFAQAGLTSDFRESYYSVSKKNVIRGMHFQVPPMDHTKLVYVTSGSITDVVLDIREGSPTYGQYFSAELSAKNRHLMYIPPGFAHGFLSLQDGSSVTYLQTTTHSPDHDRGIHVDSFGMTWGIENPILSQRDQSFPSLKDFQTPFTYQSSPQS